MQIPRSYIENYSNALNVVSDRARAELVEALSQIDYTADIESIREAVIAVMQRSCGASSTLAARIAADFYEGLRAMFGIDDGYLAQVDSMRDPEATSGAVRAFVQDLVDGKPVEQFINKCASRIDYETRKAANECIAANARRDPRKPTWARIPAGAETCQFCIMLASRGFVYHSEATASHAHANCDCRIVPSWDKSPKVQGYNPDKYYDEWVDSGFKPSSGGGGSSSSTSKRTAKNLGRGGKFAKSGINGMNEYLRSSKSLDELYQRAEEVLNDINKRWNEDSSMFASASRTAKEMRSKLQ